MTSDGTDVSVDTDVFDTDYTAVFAVFPVSAPNAVNIMEDVSRRAVMTINFFFNMKSLLSISVNK